MSSDPINNKTGILLFKNQRLGPYFKSELYDPDVHGTDPTQSGKIIPAKGDIIIDDIEYIDTGAYIAYVVVFIDPVTFKSTLEPLAYPVKVGDEETKIISYGNDRFVVYFDDRVKPVRLSIDSKLVIFGKNNVEYRLTRYSASGNKEIISAYIDSDENIISDRIPLTDISGLVGAKVCTNCHTLYTMYPGDALILEVFNSAGVLTAKVNLMVERATILNDLSSALNPIISFNVSASQMIGEDFFVYERQDPKHLGLLPEITYADGKREIVPIDSIQCFLYGLEEFIPSYAGYKTKFLIKYYLNYKQTSTIAIDNGRERYLAIEKNLIVIPSASAHGLKISVIPQFSGTDSEWKLKFFAYTDERDAVYDVTPHINMIEPFDGTNVNSQQHIVYEFDAADVFGLDYNHTYRQATWISVRPNTIFEKFIIKDSANDEYAYGVESSILRRPVIHYDNTIKKYFIPTSVFANKEAVIEAFYKLARPPFNRSVEIEPVKPTHFTVRSPSSGTTILASPIELDQYEQAWNAILPGAANGLVGSTIIVEFLVLIGEEYKILYGVPVDVLESPTGYNV